MSKRILSLTWVLGTSVAVLTACGSTGSTGGASATSGAGTGGLVNDGGHGPSSSSGAGTGGHGGQGTGSSTSASTGSQGTGGQAADAGSDAADGGNSLCKQTGGTETVGLCCASQGDLPTTCGIGSCTCAPSSSHDVTKCDCPTGKCYDHTQGCVASM